MGNTAIPPIPQTVGDTSPSQGIPLPTDATSDVNGGVLGHAVLGALASTAPKPDAPLPSDAVTVNTNTTPPPPPEKGILENILEGVNQSIPFRKEINIGTQDAINLIRLGYEKLRGQGKNIGISDVLETGHSTEEGVERGEQTAQPSVARDIGEVGGNVAQFILGDEALKGLSLADRLGVASKIAKAVEGSPKAAQALDIGMTALQRGAIKASDIGMTALRQGTVSGGLTLAKGEPASEAGENAAVTGVVSAGLGGIGVGAGALYESIARQTPEAIAEAKALAVDSGSKLANDIANKSTGVGSSYEGAQLIKQQITAAQDAMHADYAQGLHNIIEKAGDVTTNIESSPLLQTAKDYASMSDVPEALQSALQNPTAQGAKVAEFADEIVNGEQKDFNVKELEGMRRVVGNKVRMLESNPAEYEARNAWISIRESLDQTIQKALGDAGLSQSAKELSDLRSVYADQIKSFESNVIQRLSEGHPNAVADVLLNKESIFNVNLLRHVIGPENMQPVEGQLLKRLIERATTDGEFQPKSFVRNFNNLGPDVQKAIWGDNLPKVKDFLNVVRAIPKESPRWNGLAHYLEHRGIFDVLLGGAAFGGFFGYGEVKGERLLIPSAIVAGVVMLHSAAALNVASKILSGAAAATVPVVAGAMATPPNNEFPTDQGSPQELPPGYVHVRASDGSEFYIPQEKLSHAQDVDKNLQIIQQPQ